METKLCIFKAYQGIIGKKRGAYLKDLLSYVHRLYGIHIVKFLYIYGFQTESSTSPVPIYLKYYSHLNTYVKMYYTVEYQCY